MFYSQEAEDHENDIRIALNEKRERDLVRERAASEHGCTCDACLNIVRGEMQEGDQQAETAKIEEIKNLVRSALAALSQKKTHQADIDYAKSLLRAISHGQQR